MDAAAGRLPLNAWSTAGWWHARQAPVDATALIRGMFHKVSDKPQPGMGVFPSDWLESTFMPAAVRKVTSTSRAARVLAAVRRAAGRQRPAPRAVAPS
jgi:hypothetical protein